MFPGKARGRGKAHGTPAAPPRRQRRLVGTADNIVRHASRTMALRDKAAVATLVALLRGTH